MCGARVGGVMDLATYDVGIAVVGLAALLAAWVPAYTARRPLSLPIVLVAVGAVASMLPIGLPGTDPRHHVQFVERFTELGVVVSLMGSGLKIDRPFSWRAWATTWRLLGIAMPATIVLGTVAALLVLDVGLAAALLLGALLAPTDPVLASDVQVGEPTLVESVPIEAEGDVRFALTSEGGLNDALAFPFVYLALRAGSDGAAGAFGFDWLAGDLLGRTAIGLACGWVIGKILGVIAFRPPGRLSALAETPQGFVAVAITLLAYGATQLLHGYGFLAVFVAAVVLRGSERHHDFHAALHNFAEQTENLLVVGLLLLFGSALTSGIHSTFGLREIGFAVLLVFVIRPIAGVTSLIGSPLSTAERRSIAFFGIRGFGSIYYLAFALSAHSFEETDTLWAAVLVVLTLSIATHGVTATPAMAVVDRAAHLRLARRTRRVRAAGHT